MSEIERGAIVQFRVDWENEPTLANTGIVKRVAKDKSWADVSTLFGKKRVKNPSENLKVITEPLVVYI